MPSRRSLAFVVAVLALAVAARAQGTPGEQLFGDEQRLDKRPRAAGDWITYTQDAPGPSTLGRVIVENLVSGERHDLGPGFASDIDVWPDGGGGVSPEGCSDPSVRVAYLHLDAQDVLSVRSACLRAGTSVWTHAVLLASTPWAEEVRVSGGTTVWSGVDAQLQTRILVHEAGQVRTLSVGPHAFRPEILRRPNGSLLVFWDQYLEGQGHLDYEVFFVSRPVGGAWSAPRNLSVAPASTDMEPSAALAPDGSVWVAWRTDRGAAEWRVIVGRLQPNGSVHLTQPYPPTSDPGELGMFDPIELRGLFEPQLCVDEQGTPWLFVNHRSIAPEAFSYDKQLYVTRYEGAAWTAPEIVSNNLFDELHLDPVVRDGAVRAVYQTNDTIRRSVDVGLREFALGSLAPPPVVAAPTVAPEPPLPYAVPVLPEQRLLELPDATWRLVFADLHTHCKRSPDGMGELDHAYFWARDVAQLDVLGSTDHDERANNWLSDWEYELGLRFHALFEGGDMLVMHGFEWTSSGETYGGETIGHRATVDASRVYRNTDAGADELTEYYALMRAEDAIGVPHHLGKLGGATFLLHDPQVQPITQVASVHGVYETELHEKLHGDQARFGVTAASDDHTAHPSRRGMAGVWIDADGPLDRESFKQGLRARRTFALRDDGMWVDVRVLGAPAGSIVEHHGPLSASYALDEVPTEGPYTVSLIRDGDLAAPLHVSTEPAGSSPVRTVALPAHADSAYYMLRVTAGTGTASEDTLLWTTPVWVDHVPPKGFPQVFVDVQPQTTAGVDSVPLADVRLWLHDPDGLADLAALELVALDADGRARTLPRTALPVPDGEASSGQLELPALALPRGTTTLLVRVRDSAGRLAVHAASLAP